MQIEGRTLDVLGVNLEACDNWKGEQGRKENGQLGKGKRGGRVTLSGQKKTPQE